MKNQEEGEQRLQTQRNNEEIKMPIILVWLVYVVCIIETLHHVP